MSELGKVLSFVFWVAVFLACAAFVFLRAVLPYLAGAAGAILYLATMPPRGSGRR